MSTATPGSRNQRKTQIGFVTSRSGDKSVKVTIAYKTPHPLYHKVVNRQTVLHVHDEKNETKVGDCRGFDWNCHLRKGRGRLRPDQEFACGHSGHALIYL